MNYYLYAAIYTIVGILLLFLGYRIYKSTLALSAFLLGALFGFVVLSLTQIGMVFVLVGAFIFGIVGLIFAKPVEMIVFLTAGALLGAFVAMAVGPQLLPDFPRILVIVVFAFIGAALSLVMKRPIMIAGTSLAGAALTTFGVSSFITGTDTWNRFRHGTLSNQQIYLIIILVLALVGAAVQVFHRKK